MLPHYLKYFDLQQSIPATTYDSQLQPLFAKIILFAPNPNHITTIAVKFTRAIQLQLAIQSKRLSELTVTIDHGGVF